MVFAGLISARLLGHPCLLQKSSQTEAGREHFRGRLTRVGIVLGFLLGEGRVL